MDTSTDEHDLAKALDSVAAELDAQKAAKTGDSSTKGYLFSESASAATPGSEPVVLPGSPVAPVAAVNSVVPAVDTQESATEVTLASALTENESLAPAASSDLDDIKKDALVELRPLVGKLNVSPEEKFDTYLLLIRSTDDKALIAPAHEAAKSIEDEARRAEALLEIIKEIDYLSKQEAK